MLSAIASQSLIACCTTRLESPQITRRVAPHVLDMRMPWSSASYSASLLEAWLKLIWRTCLSFVPLGETSTTPAPAPCCLLDPSKNIVHELDRSGGPSVWTSVHSTRRSRSTCALIVVGCLNCRSHGLSSMFHSTTRSVAPGLLRMSASGVLLMIVIGCSSK